MDHRDALRKQQAGWMKQRHLEAEMNAHGVYSSEMETQNKHLLSDLTMRITDKLQNELQGQ